MKYIFEVLIDADYSAEQYAAAWLEASRLIQQSAGARGTYLHRDLHDPRRLLAIAHWDSKAARDASHASQDPAIKAIIQSQAEHVQIRFLGEFADADWQVEPAESSTKP
jgi:quinol monooxygenase YgiN